MHGLLSYGKEYFTSGGAEVVYKGEVFELCSPWFSGHGDKIVNIYLCEKGVKVMLGYSKNGVEVYRYRTMADSEHYWSTVYSIEKAKKIIKYSGIVKLLEDAYRHHFE